MILSSIQRLLVFIRNTTTFQVTITSVSLLFIIFTLVAPNNKFIFVFSAAYVAFIFILTKSFEKTLIYIFIPLSLISVGQLYKVTAIPREWLQHPLYPEGRSLFFTYSPFFVLSIASIAGYLVRLFKAYKVKHFTLSLLFFAATYFFSIVSAFLSVYFPILSFFYVIASVGLFSWGLLLISYYHEISSREKSILISQLLELLIIVIIVESIIVSIQFVTRNTLGIILEQTDLVPYFGGGADENPFQFRPVGFETHANHLANKFLHYLFGFTFFVNARRVSKIDSFLLKKSILQIVFLLILIVIFLTQSRSAYLALFCALLVLMTMVKSELIIFFKNIYYIYKKYTIFFFCFLIVATVIFTDRLLMSIYSFSPQGGLGVRELLLEESKNLFLSNPIWGVGTGMFIPAAYQQNQQGVMGYFPESVHNGFILFLVESGLLSLLMASIGWYFLVRETVKSSVTKLFKGILLAYIAAISMIMMFQPFVNFLPWWIPIIIITRESNEDKNKIK